MNLLDPALRAVDFVIRLPSVSLDLKQLFSYALQPLPLPAKG
jgi:hypothetical protein